MKRMLMLIIFGIFLILSACGTGDDGGENPSGTGGGVSDSSDADGIFKENCATCHGEDLSGGTGPDLTDVGQRLSEDEIEEVIEDGKGAMPSGLISGQEQKTVAEWLSDMK